MSEEREPAHPGVMDDGPHLEEGPPIEDEEYDEEPINPAQTDWPGGGGEGAPGGSGRAAVSPPPLDDGPELSESFAWSTARDEEELLEDAPDPAGLKGKELAAALVESLTEVELEELDWYRDNAEAAEEEREIAEGFRELPAGTDPNDLAQTGWGILFAEGEEPGVYAAFEPLIARRKEQTKGRFKEETYKPPESASSFLWSRFGVAPGILDTRQAPFYWLIVGGPEKIPFELQYGLQVNHAVGRVCFERVEDYFTYVEAVLAAEDGELELPRKVTFFSVEEEMDQATEIMARKMVVPVSRHLSGSPFGWDVEVHRAERATGQRLRRLLGGADSPALVLASAHGRRFRCCHPKQEELQGSLVFELERSEGRRSLPVKGLFHADCVDPESDSRGQIAFLFSCYGAGTPQVDNFPDIRKQAGVEGPVSPAQIARRPFVARLPQKLLAKGGLAVVSHIDRGWTLSFSWGDDDQTEATIASLKDTLDQLLGGYRLGAAMRALHRRFTSLATFLSEFFGRARLGQLKSEHYLAFLWKAYNDARNTIILGDPAVRLASGARDREVLAPWEEAEAEPREIRGLPVFLHDEVLERAHRHARAAGLTLGDWLHDLLEGHLGRLARGAEMEEILRSWEEELGRVEETGNRRGELKAHNELGRALRALGEGREAVTHHEAQLELARQLEDREAEVKALGNLGLACRAANDDRRALDLWHELLKIARERGDRAIEGKTLGNLANVYRDLGDHARARELYDQRIALARRLGDHRGEVLGLWNQGELHEQRGELERAAALMQQRVDYERRTGSPLAEEHARKVAEIRKRMGW